MEDIQEVLDTAPPGSAILLSPGEYVLTRTLVCRRRVHLFGKSAATLVLPPGLVRGPSHAILWSAPFATLDGLRIDAQGRGSCALRMTAGWLRLQGCELMAAENSPLATTAVLVAAGAASRLEMRSCTVTGGGGGIRFAAGASGLVSGTTVTGATGNGLEVKGVGTCPEVTGCTFVGCAKGVLVRRDVDTAWAMGEGNAFVGCGAEEKDERREEEVMQPQPAADAEAEVEAGAEAGAGAGAGALAGAGAAGMGAGGGGDPNWLLYSRPELWPVQLFPPDPEPPVLQEAAHAAAAEAGVDVPVAAPLGGAEQAAVEAGPAAEALLGGI